MFASTAVIGILAAIKDLNANFIQAILASDGDVKFPLYNIYEKPYCRINAYRLGRCSIGVCVIQEALKWKVKFIFGCVYVFTVH